MTAEQVTVLVVAGGRVARLVNDVDIAVADTIEAEIVRQTEPTVGLIVDLSAVSFMDSAGLRLLDRLAGRQRHAGASLRVVAPRGGPPRFSLEMSGFPRDLLDDDLPTAVKTL